LEGKQLIDGLDCAIASQTGGLEMEVLLWGIQYEICKAEQLLQLLRRSVVGDLLLPPIKLMTAILAAESLPAVSTRC
jgi:hypothetical protein